MAPSRYRARHQGSGAWRRLWACVCVLFGVAALVLPAAFEPGTGVAFAKKKERRKPPPAREVQTVGDRARRALTAAQDAISKGDYAAAEKQLKKLESSGKRNTYETALIQQLYGHVYSGRNDYKRAIKAFDAAVATQALPKQAELNLRYNLGQLYVMTEQYEKAIRALEAWHASVENPSPQAHVLLAQSYVSMGKYRKALPPMQRAIQRSKQPKEPWLRLLLAIHLELEQLAPAADVLEKLVARYSSKTYWTQLSAVYGSLGRDKASLNAMEVAYRQGYLTESVELVRMAELYLYNEIPYQAGVVLEQGLSEGQIDKTLKNWRLLADSWLAAREFERAVGPLERAAKLSGDGDLSLRLGHLHLQNENWKRAAEALRSALKKGGLDKPSSAQLLLGISLFQLGDEQGSERAFRSAAAHASTRAAAQEWLAHLRR